MALSLLVSGQSALGADWNVEARGDNELCPIAVISNEPAPNSSSSFLEWQRITPDDWENEDWDTIVIESREPPFRLRLYRQEDGQVYAADSADREIDYGVLQAMTLGALPAYSLGLNAWSFSANGARVLEASGRFYLITQDSRQEYEGPTGDPPERIGAYRLTAKSFELACRFKPAQ